MSKRGLVVQIAVGAGAIAAFVIGYHFGGEMHAVNRVEGDAHLHRVLAYSLAGAFFLMASYSVRQLANQLGRAIALADTATAASVRLILTILGLVVILLLALVIVRIGVSQLLLGGAITGVVLGIAAQQSLGNVFAGIVLLMARPFRAGDQVRVRTGSLGGPMEGRVVSMGLIYVVFSTEEGTTLVPNLTLLASGIVRSPRPMAAPTPLVVIGTPVDGAAPAGTPVGTPAEAESPVVAPAPAGSSDDTETSSPTP